jgi:Rod binding domain-containing protein
MEGLKPLAMGPVTVAEPDLEGLGRRVRNGDKSALAALGQQFEQLFLSQILKEMRRTLEPDGLFGKDSGDVLGGIFDLYLGKHLAGAGGLGLGAMLQQHLEPQLNPCATSPATTSCATIMRRYQHSA